MKSIGTALAAMMILAASAAVCRSEPAAAGDQAAMEQQHAAVMTKSLYVCPHCDVVATEAGKCPKCGMDMKEQHLLGVKDGKAMLCACSAGCKCDASEMKDGKCSCGKAVKEESLKGLYVCPAGCGVVSDKPGKCGGCGKELEEVK